ncbi:hypothetical protein C8F04DRAFT_408543 [Mycena alexandri]|uniref:Uncharacterized protein n=1 Tax=Mycena alexandri TaxID=1745969 RepID=A0AAD6WMG4_9AGAR|nr:hypothetical protein C8F04DRAFT_408543 [Mycena alexandri]
MDSASYFALRYASFMLESLDGVANRSLVGRFDSAMVKMTAFDAILHSSSTDLEFHSYQINNSLTSNSSSNSCSGTWINWVSLSSLAFLVFRDTYVLNSALRSQAQSNAVQSFPLDSKFCIVSPFNSFRSSSVHSPPSLSLPELRAATEVQPNIEHEPRRITQLAFGSCTQTFLEFDSKNPSPPQNAAVPRSKCLGKCCALLI